MDLVKYPTKQEGGTYLKDFKKRQAYVVELLIKMEAETVKTANVILEDIKSRTNTYREARGELSRLKDAVMYNHSSPSKITMMESVFITAEMILEEEISDLPLTNRPQ